jgi:tRNA(adenine34) deaminase
LARQHNRVEQNVDASAHAELLALRQAARRTGNWRLNNGGSKNQRRRQGDNNNNNNNGSKKATTGAMTAAATTTTLYSTLEPCVMCCAAAQAFRVDRIVYGARDVRLGAIESHISLLQIPHPYHRIREVMGGGDGQQDCRLNYYANESQALLQQFFRTRRQERQEARQKTKEDDNSFSTRGRRRRYTKMFSWRSWLVDMIKHRRRQ